MNDDEILPLDIEIGRVFTPAAPVSDKEIFSGRETQLRRVVDAINQQGQHAVIFGERGVGKTSLSNTLATKIVHPGASWMIPRVNCDGQDLYADAWKKAFRGMQRAARRFDDVQDKGDVLDTLNEVEEEADSYLNPGDVCNLLEDLSRHAGIAVIFDEFDRIDNKQAKRAFADTIKAISDQDIHATIILVGVADSVDDLIAEHQSIERNLIQVPMPRMSSGELEEILEKGCKKIGMTISNNARSAIAHSSRGLPHYTHLLGLHAARNAVQKRRKNITIDDVREAIRNSLEDVQQSIRNAYHKAVFSPQREAIFKQVLAACALAEVNELGWFRPTDVKEPLSRIMGKPYEIGGFAPHLGRFSESLRGSVLERVGEKNRYLFRFKNPLMQPFAILKGIQAGFIPESLDTLFD